MYQKNTENGYIVSIAKGVTHGNITEEEYNAILAVIRSKPTAPEGYDYKLREDLTWELFEIPTPEPEEEEATEEDYKEALNQLGGNTDEEESA